MPLRFPPRTAETHTPPLTIRHLLDSSRLSAAQEEIVYRDQQRLTYADLHRRIGQLAGALSALGVTQGSCVAVLDWDSHRYLEAYLAVPMMGAVLQTANFRHAPEQLHYALDHAGAQVLLVHRDFLPLVDALRATLPGVHTIIALMDGDDTPPPDWCAGEYEALLAKAAPVTRFEDFDENALATTFYTSGTTGLPKAVCFTHRQLVLHTLAAAAALGVDDGVKLSRGDVYMPLTPMFHVHAWGMPYVAVMLGMKQVYPGRYEPERILRMRREEGVTFSHCVPTVLQMLLDAAGEEHLDGWRFIIGGSAVTRELAARARAQGAGLIAGYGMSETGPVIAIARAGDDLHEAIRSGTPIPLVSARIVDDAMQDLPMDDAACGELVLRAPWLTPSYPGDEPASDALWRGGWLHTQDVAAMRGDGSIQIRDRIKDVIKTGGEWISSLALEDLIAARDDVAEVAVIGIPCPKWQERPMAVIVPAAGRQPQVAAIRATLGEAIAAGRISRFCQIDALVCVPALPRTSVGKIDKKAIRQMVLAGAAPSFPPIAKVQS